MAACHLPLIQMSQQRRHKSKMGPPHRKGSKIPKLCEQFYSDQVRENKHIKSSSSPSNLPRSSQPNIRPSPSAFPPLVRPGQRPTLSPGTPAQRPTIHPGAPAQHPTSPMNRLSKFSLNKQFQSSYFSCSSNHSVPRPLEMSASSLSVSNIFTAHLSLGTSQPSKVGGVFAIVSK